MLNVKFNDTEIGTKIFSDFDLDGFGFQLNNEYKYDELEAENCHRPNFLYFLLSRGKEDKVKALYDIKLFHPDTPRDKIWHLEGFLHVTIEYALKNDELWKT